MRLIDGPGPQDYTRKELPEKAKEELATAMFSRLTQAERCLPMKLDGSDTCKDSREMSWTCLAETLVPPCLAETPLLDVAESDLAETVVPHPLLQLPVVPSPWAYSSTESL